MSLFPEVPPFKELPMIVPFRTLRNGADPNDPVQCRDMSGPTPLRQFTLAWDDAMTSDDEALIYEFWILHRGATRFEFFSFDHLHKWKAIPAGSGNGVIVDFNIGGKETSLQTIKVAGSVNTNWTLQEGLGVNGQDLVTFGTAPSGAVTADFTGRIYCPKCIFKDDAITFAAIGNSAHKASCTVQEVSR